jgi:phenylacetic acid degradation operon negative regulatory protein
MTLDLSTVAHELIGRFRRQKPLRGGSLIVTIFGDSLMPRGGSIALGSLIRITAPFGLNERLVRTATTRLAQEGWLQARRAGKLSEYQLSGTGRERFAEATERIYGEPNTPWTGRWTLLVLPALRASERDNYKKELAWQGFGELTNGIFAHPESRPNGFDLQTLGFKLPTATLMFTADLSRDTAPSNLVDLGWDLADLGKRYQRFLQRFERAAIATKARSDPKAAFIVRTLLIHDYRRLHLRDPLLPQRLLPAEWPGTRAAELCRDIYPRLFTASESYLSEHAAQLDGPLPAAGPAILKRFGGLR